MRFIREVTQDKGHCVIRTQTYARGVDYILSLVTAAKWDFPTLKDEDISIAVYGGERYKGTIGIEFRPPSQVPSEYETIQQLELTLC